MPILCLVRLARIGVLALVLAMSGAAQARTIRQAVPTSVAFWDRDHGVASFVVFGPTDRSQGYVSTTADGGRTWTIRWRGVAVSDVAVVRGTREAWVELASQRIRPDDQAPMIHTADLGRTWQQAGTAPSTPSFPTPRIGFAMRSRDGNAGPLTSTSDAGRTWRRVGVPCRRGWGGFAESAAISFVSARQGWVMCAGQPGAGNQSKALYVTRNGGTTWKRLLNAYFEPGRIRLGGLAGGYLRGINFTRTGHGLMWLARGRTRRTSDGGRHWRPISASSPETREAYSGWLVSDRFVYLLLENSGRRPDWELLRSVDGGRSWRLVRSWARL
jgi:photosystem II stability/assembly factor-like uncharacterized protein